MSVSVSARERRFWTWALAVIVAIYATVGLAGRLVDAIGGSIGLAVAFGMGFLMVILAVVAGGLRRPSAGRELWVLVGVIAVYLMVVVRMGVTPAERTHLFEYGLVGVLVHEALRERYAGRTLLPAALAVLITAVVGWIDEGIQSLLPDRVYDLRDVGTNALAGLMAVVATLVLRRARPSDSAHGKRDLRSAP